MKKALCESCNYLDWENVKWFIYSRHCDAWGDQISLKRMEFIEGGFHLDEGQKEFKCNRYKQRSELWDFGNLRKTGTNQPSQSSVICVRE
jgi:hypothetical protein